MAKSTAMPTNSTPKPTETRLSVPIAADGEQQRQHQPEAERAQDRHDQPPAPHRQQQPERDQHHAADEPGDSALRDGGELRVGQRDRPGDAHARRAARARIRASPPRRASPAVAAPPGCSELKSSLGWTRTNSILAAEIAEPCRSAGAARTAACGWPAIAAAIAAWNACNCAEIGREVRVVVRHALPKQRQRREQAARGGVGGELAEERLRIDGAIQQVGELRGVEKQQPFLAEIGRGVRAADRAEMRVIAGERMRQSPAPWRRPPPARRRRSPRPAGPGIAGRRAPGPSACCRQGRLAANIWSVSVFDPEVAAGIEAGAVASRIPASTTRHACLRQRSTSRDQGALRQRRQRTTHRHREHAAGQVGDLLLQAGQQGRHAAACQQMTKVRALHGDTADRAVGQHVHGPPAGWTVAHDVIEFHSTNRRRR